MSPPITDTPHPPVTVTNQHSATLQGSKKTYIPRRTGWLCCECDQLHQLLWQSRV